MKTLLEHWKALSFCIGATALLLPWAIAQQPGQGEPGQEVPEQAVPGQAVPGQAVPGQAVPGQAVPGQAVPGQAVPEEMAEAPGGTQDEDYPDFPPRKFDARRYDAIFQKDPFMNEVAIETQGEEVVDEWAKDLVIRAVTRITGKYVVHVEDTSLKNEKDPEKLKMRFHRLVEGDNSAKLRVQSVKPHRDPTQVEVVVLNGSGNAAKTATIKYNDKEIVAKAVATPPPVTSAPTVSRRVTPPTGARPAAATPPPTTTPGKRRVIMPPGLK